MQSKLNACKQYLSNLFAHFSIRNRLILVTGLWLSLMVSIAGIVIPLLINYQLEQNAKSELEFTQDELYKLLKQNKLPTTDHFIISNSKLYENKQSRFWQIETDDNTFKSPSLGDKDLTDKFEDKYHEIIQVSNKYKIDSLGKVKIKVALDNDEIEESVVLLTGVLWFILGLLFVGVLVLVAFQLTWSLQPLTKLQQALIKLKLGEVNRIDGNYPKEIEPLASSLNDLLFHYQELLKRARNHTGNMAHALKTPLTVLKNQIKHYPEEEQQSLLVPVNNIQHYIDYHLSRARLAGSSSILSVKSSPAERIEAINIAFDKVYAHREILLINEIDDDIVVNVDTNDLDEMLGNLLENSYKWAKSTIRIYSESYSEHRLQLIIEDDGCGISEQQFKHALQRGARLDEKVTGSGLGLNIVQDIVESYQGSIQLDHASLGGLKVILTLPC